MRGAPPPRSGSAPLSAVLGFDTATDDTAVAAVRDGEVAFESALAPAEEGRPQHATQLMPELERAAAVVGGWGSVDRIAVGIGPGSFTGLRVGIATARALAQSLRISVAGVGTLAALAHGIAARGGGADRARLALVDARRGEVFAALFDRAGSQVWQPFVAAPRDLAERLETLAEPPLAAGSGALRFRDELQGRAEIPEDEDPAHRVAGRDVCAVGALGEAADPRKMAPIYLRPPDAERWHKRDGRNSRDSRDSG
jgi:tRNA threonylcarbamoyladenosine biosynthesis protein TsaB